MSVRTAALLASCTACAATTSVCPIGTKRVDVHEPQGRAQWCASSESQHAAVPLGRTFEASLGQPRAMTAGVQGPFTSWYPNGNVESHGGYLDFGERSVPDGVWAFWYPSGQRRTLGVYHRGEPAGCFAVWDEHGARSTGFVEGTDLRVAPCTPPADDGLAQFEGASAVAASAAWGDISLQGLVGSVTAGARNELQIEHDPSLQAAFEITARKRIGMLRAGALAGVRLSGNVDYRGYAVGGVVALDLPRLHPRVEAELAAELAAQYVTATARRPQQPGTADLTFWSPLPALQLGVSLALSPYLAAVVAGRVEGTPVRDVDREVVYCSVSGCLPAQEETWQVGGFSYGLTLGLRLLIR